MNKIIFYNWHQHGDLSLSRGIVNWIVNHSPNNVEFLFGMTKHLLSVFFGDRVKTFSLEHGQYQFVNQHIGYVGPDYITTNLWIGSSPSFLNRDNTPRNSLNNPMDYTAEHIFNHCYEIIDYLNNNRDIKIPYPQNEADVLPKANLYPLQKQNVDNFLNSINHYNKKILICNGELHSLQTPNFSLSQCIESFVNEHPEIAFIYTANFSNPKPNEFFINNYCDRYLPNLNEIDYVSTHCDILITRRSGPGEIIQTYENFFDPNKTIISLYSYSPGQWIFTNGKAKLDWTDNFSSESIINLIKKHI